MKKVLFLQIKGNSCGGVWFVNKTIGEALINHGYDVEVMSVRDSHSGIDLEYDSRLKVSIVNNRDEWEIVHFCDVKNDFKKLHFISAIGKGFKFLVDRYKLKKDFKYIRNYIISNDFDYIVTTQYQLLDIIPNKFLKRTIHEQHTSFKASYEHMATRKAFDKYKNSDITFLWLTKATCDEAIKRGYKNSTYIYNPVRFTVNERANVVKNKKLITIARISSEKRIDLMVKMVNDILSLPDFKEWKLEIYGDGVCKEDILKMDYDKNKIKFMGQTNDVSKVLLTSSINLNTSVFEGFAMGVLEANECGVPTVSFRFGESIDEEIIQNKTGIYVEQDDIDNYKKELMGLMSDLDRLDRMSLECKKFSKKFIVNSIIEDWLKLLK